MVCQICGKEATVVLTDNGQISAWCEDHAPNEGDAPDLRDLIAYLKYDADLWRANGSKGRDSDKA